MTQPQTKSRSNSLHMAAFLCAWMSTSLLTSAAPAQAGKRGNSRSASAGAAGRITARWLGQDDNDFVGPGSEAKPSGVQDIHLRVEGLPANPDIKFLVVQGHGGDEWQFGGANGSWAAHMVRTPGQPRAEVYLEPTRVENGREFTLKFTWSDGRTSELIIKGGKADPGLRMASSRMQPRWVGQDGADYCGDGPSVGPDGLIDAHIQITNLPQGLPISSATITAPDRKAWEYGVNPLGHANAELVSPHKKLKGAAHHLYFQCDANRAGQKLRLEVTFYNGTRDSTELVAGEFDPRRALPASKLPDAARLRGASLKEPKQSARTSPPLPPGRLNAKPGDDLQAIARRGGSIQLAPGRYALDAPLVLDHATALLGSRDCVLVFKQPQNSADWTTAIKIHSGNTTLSGFRVRFEGPVRWDRAVSWGPAIIGTTDNRDESRNDPKTNITLENLDIEAPQPATDWEEAPRIARLITAANGRVENCTFRGGAIEIEGGPWQIVKNEHIGTHPHSFAFSVISAHRTKDLLVELNKTRAEGASGKVWRFLVMTNGGSNDVIRNNAISGIGPRDDDTVNENAPEIILTESYRVRFEGKPRLVSQDGRVLLIGQPQGGEAHVGEIVAILAGKHAGAWRRISACIDANTYLVDPPLPTDAEIPSISISDNGFVNESFESNTIDAEGASQAAGFVLAGHHYGTRILNNTVRGCGEAFRIVASPTEHPIHWGWSHTPMFGIAFEGNRIENSARGALLAVEHGSPVKSSRGRVYWTGTARGNTLVPGATGSARIVVGDARTLDPQELQLTTDSQTHTTRTPRPDFLIEAGVVDGVVSHQGRVADRVIAPKR